MKKRSFSICLWVCLAACLAQSGNRLNSDRLRASNPGMMREAFFLSEFDAWNGVLNLIYYDRLRLGARSAQPRDYLIKLTDGVRGSFEDFPGSFLLFDGSRAEIEIDIPQWQEFGSLKFNAVEVEGERPSSVQLIHWRKGGPVRTLALQRKPVKRKGKVWIVEYATGSADVRLDAGLLILSVDNHNLEFVFLDEIVFDQLSDAQPPALNFAGDLKQWEQALGPGERQRIQAGRGGETLKDEELLKLLMGRPSSRFDTKLVFMHETRTDDGANSIFSLLLQVDRTGSRALDLARAYLVVPRRVEGGLPLMILSHQGTVFGADEPLGFLGRAELALAGELAQQGVASLVVESFYHNGFRETVPGLYSYHPHWSVTGKEVDNVSRCLTIVLSDSFQKLFGVKYDSRRIGISGFSFGAFNSLLCALMDSRFSLLAMAHLENYSKDWDSFAEALYIPQLSFLRTEKPYPLHVSRMLRSLTTQRVLVSVGDSGLAKHYSEHLEAAKNIRVLNNPIGKVFTYSERARFVDFIFEGFGIASKAQRNGPAYNLDDDPARYIARENRWRNLLIEKLRE
jgi:hypothetical protein